MDCQMPDLDGYAATAIIREAEARDPASSRLPIIAMTANAMQGDRDACLKAGMDDYLSKPVVAEELQAVLRRWLPVGNREQGTGTQRVPGEQGIKDGAQGAADTQHRPEGTRRNTQHVVPSAVDEQALARLRSLPAKDGVDFLQRVIGTYIDEAPISMQRMTEAVGAEDAEVLRQAAHKLRGSSANFGAKALVGLCEEIEAVARSGTTKGTRGLLRRINAEFERVIGALDAQREQVEV
jgi:HPt (histidine-containing phosphotransfer) domain-containing protein